MERAESAENTSMPTQALATIGIPPARAVYGAYPSVNQSRDKERNFHFLDEVYQMGSGFSQVHSHRALTLGPKTCSLFVLITTTVKSREAISAPTNRR